MLPMPGRFRESSRGCSLVGDCSGGVRLKEGDSTPQRTGSRNRIKTLIVQWVVTF